MGGSYWRGLRVEQRWLQFGWPFREALAFRRRKTWVIVQCDSFLVFACMYLPTAGRENNVCHAAKGKFSRPRAQESQYPCYAHVCSNWAAQQELVYTCYCTLCSIFVRLYR